MKYTLLVLVMALVCLAKAQGDWKQQSIDFSASLDSQGRKITICQKAQSVNEEPSSNVYIKNNIASNVALDNSLSGCEIYLGYEVNCKGEIGNFKYTASMLHPNCKPMYAAVANYLNHLPAVEPFTQDGKVIDVKIESIRISYGGANNGFGLSWYD